MLPLLFRPRLLHQSPSPIAVSAASAIRDLNSQNKTAVTGLNAGNAMTHAAIAIAKPGWPDETVAAKHVPANLRSAANAA